MSDRDREGQNASVDNSISSYNSSNSSDHKFSFKDNNAALKRWAVLRTLMMICLWFFLAVVIGLWDKIYWPHLVIILSYFAMGICILLLILWLIVGILLAMGLLPVKSKFDRK